MASWNWTPAGVAMAVFLGGVYFLMGHFAHLIRRAEATRRENQRLIAELSVANRRLQDYVAQTEEFAAGQERRRLARELHDSATQTIFSMNLTVQTARMLLDRDPGRVAGQLDQLQKLTTGAVGEIHALLDRLHAPSETSAGLPAALRRVVLEREKRDSLQIHLEVTGEKDLPEPVVAGLCRIVQEALNNVAKHAETREAIVRLDLDGQRASIEIVDHGIGFDPGAVSMKGERLGISGMAERARELGWKLICDSRPGHGTRIRAEEA